MTVGISDSIITKTYHVIMTSLCCTVIVSLAISFFEIRRERETLAPYRTKKHSSIICAMKLKDARRNIRPSLPHKNKKTITETFVHILSHTKNGP